MKAWQGGLGMAALAALAAGLGLLALGLASPPPEPGHASVGTLHAAVPALPLPAWVPPAAVLPLPAAMPARKPVPSDPELDRLVAAARRGDAGASHAAYRLLSACAAPEGPACPGLPASLVQERLRFLAQAVRAGLPAAQIDFYMEGPAQLQALDEQALQAWRQEALAGLQSAASRCEPFAAGLLATLHDSGELAPRDATLAAAYAVAEGELRRRPPTDAALRDRLAEPIADAALAAARQQGLSLAAACR